MGWGDGGTGIEDVSIIFIQITLVPVFVTNLVHFRQTDCHKKMFTQKYVGENYHRFLYTSSQQY